jgi:hypothetical protein
VRDGTGEQEADRHLAIALQDQRAGIAGLTEYRAVQANDNDLASMIDIPFLAAATQRNARASKPQKSKTERFNFLIAHAIGTRSSPAEAPGCLNLLCFV